MNLTFVTSDLIERMGWTLAHTVWQGAAAAALLAILLYIGKRWSATVRYALSCTALLAIVLAAGITFALLAPKRTSHVPMTMPMSIDTSASIVPLPDVTASSVPIPAPPIDWRKRVLTISVIAWCIGVFAIGLTHAFGWTWLQRCRRHATLASDAWQARIAALRTRLNVPRRVALFVTDRIDVPIVLGVVRPIILAPIALLSDLPPAQIEAILAHELAHIRRNDYLVNLIQTAIETLLFYHPAVWWVGRVIRFERECVCDEIAVSVSEDRIQYVKVLTSLDRMRLIAGAPSAELVSGATGDLLGRITRILLPTHGDAVASRPRQRAASIMTIGLVMLFVAIGCAASYRQRATPLPDSSGPRSDAKQLSPSTAASSMASETTNSTIQPDDLVAVAEDYRIGPNDLLSVSIMDLTAPDLESVKNVRVAEATGSIRVPLIGDVKATGLTEQELEKEISEAYRQAGLIFRATVDVTILESRSRTFSILGAVGQPGEYQILKPNFRLLNALVYARGATPGARLRIIRETPMSGAPPRTIEIPAQAVESADPHYNVVIRPHDIIIAQAPLRAAAIRITVASDAMEIDGETVDLREVRRRIEAISLSERGITAIELVAEGTVSLGHYLEVRRNVEQLASEFALAGIRDARPSNDAPAELGANEYRITGKLLRPGTYAIRSDKPSLVRDALAAAGLDSPDVFVTLVRREGSKPAEALILNARWPALQSSSSLGDIELRGGDELIVTEKEFTDVPPSTRPATAPATQPRSEAKESNLSRRLQYLLSEAEAELAQTRNAIRNLRQSDPNLVPSTTAGGHPVFQRMLAASARLSHIDLQITALSNKDESNVQLQELRGKRERCYKEYRDAKADALKISDKEAQLAMLLLEEQDLIVTIGPLKRRINDVNAMSATQATTAPTTRP